MDKIIIRSIGGLGNQMFCYAFYKKMCQEYPDKCFVMDISDVWDKRFERGAEFLRAFPNIKICEASARDIFRIEHKFTFRYRGKGSKILRIVVDYVNKKIMSGRRKFCLNERKYKENNCMILEEEWDNIRYFDGFWQNMDYYIPYIEDIKKDFTYAPWDVNDVENLKLLTQIQETESVSVHVRRGDYVGETLDILNTAYYKTIIEDILRKNPNSHFYFFSDDGDYVREEYKWLFNKTVVENNNGLQSFRDMQLMSACKKNIIANSTFSLWAAVLNRNEKYEVFYPSHYYQGIEMQSVNLPGFIKVSVKEQKGNDK